MTEEFIEQEDKLVKDEYKIWKKNCPFLYGNISGLVGLYVYVYITFQDVAHITRE